MTQSQGSEPVENNEAVEAEVPSIWADRHSELLKQMFTAFNPGNNTAPVDAVDAVRQSRFGVRGWSTNLYFGELAINALLVGTTLAHAEAGLLEVAQKGTQAEITVLVRCWSLEGGVKVVKATNAKTVLVANALAERLDALLANNQFMHALYDRLYAIDFSDWQELWDLRSFFNDKAAIEKGLPYYHTTFRSNDADGREIHSKWGQIFLSADPSSDTFDEKSPVFVVSARPLNSERRGNSDVVVQIRQHREYTDKRTPYVHLAEVDATNRKLAWELFQKLYWQVRGAVRPGEEI